MWRVDPEIDGQVGDALVAARDPVCLVLDLLPDGHEVGELLSLAVEELAVLDGAVDELQDERAAGHNAAASGKKVPGRQKCLINNASEYVLIGAN